MKLITIFITVFMLKSCATTAQLNPNNMQKPLSGSYIFTELNDLQVPSNLNIQFNDSTKQVNGFAGCNRFFGSYSITNNTIKIGPLAATKMLCHGDRGEIESKLFQALENANSFIIKDDNEIHLLKDDKIVAKAKVSDKATSLSSYNLSYKAFSRGTYKTVEFRGNSFMYQNARNENPLTYQCTEDELLTLEQLFKKVNLDQLSKLEAPSKAHQFDGAPGATLTIIYNNESYKTVTFDHGNPPEEISELVNLILSLTESM